MSANLPIGVDDFRTLREQGLTYVDKTHFICELIDRPGAQVVLLPRPRRFGKSLALSMLRCFFDKHGADPGHLFDDLEVWRAGERYRRHFRRHPVIHLGFKDLDRERWDDVLWAVREKIRDLFDAHRDVLDAGAPSALDRERLGRILDGSAPPGLYQRALLDLTRALHRAHGEKVVLLIDDCDVPVHAGQVHGYGREALDFFRGLLATGLEGNPHLARAVLTGVTGAVLSGPSNVAVYTVLRSEFATCFGFTESEVDQLLVRDGGQGERDERAIRSEHDLIDRWYGGYRFGQHTMYNPWSVLSFLADARSRPRPYWRQTGGRDLARDVLARDVLARERPLLERLLAGESVACALDESVPLDRLQHDREALCSLLVFCGWLRAVERPPGDTPENPPRATEAPEHALSIPNHEVSTLLRSMLAEQPDAAPDPPGPAAAQPRADLALGPAATQPRQGLAPGPAAAQPREELELGSDDDLLQHRAGRARSDRSQARPPRERRPDILADAEAFEERLQSFLEEMRATGDAPASAASTDDSASLAADERAETDPADERAETDPADERAETDPAEPT